VKREVDEAKATWVRRTIEIIQPPGDARPPTPKVVCEAIFLLKRGPDARRQVDPMALYEDQAAGSGPKCDTPEGNSRVMVEELKKVFSQTGTFDPEAIRNVRQRPQQPWMDKVPTEFEVFAATAKLSNGKSGADAECPGEYWKALNGDAALSAFVNDLVVEMWRTGSYSALDPASIPDTPPAPPGVSESALKLAERQEWNISWQQVNPKRPGTGTWARYETYRHTTTIAAAKAYGCQPGEPALGVAARGRPSPGPGSRGRRRTPGGEGVRRWRANLRRVAGGAPCAPSEEGRPFAGQKLARHLPPGRRVQDSLRRHGEAHGADGAGGV